MKVVYSTSDVYEAEIIRGLLEDSGIPAHVQTDSAGGMRPSVGFAAGAKVLVPERDFEKAVEILQSRTD